MDLVLILIWFLTALGFLCALVSSSYYIFVRGAKFFDIFAKLVAALIVYLLFTIGMGFLAGLTFFIGAHADPPGSILNTRELLIGATLIIAYATIGWLMTSFIVGGLILPNRRFNRE